MMLNSPRRGQGAVVGGGHAALHQSMILHHDKLKLESYHILFLNASMSLRGAFLHPNVWLSDGAKSTLQGQYGFSADVY